ncbi:hypothetical protein KIW84_024038 [Lathyrus oleraceus]|uniref:Uncharacterized protein n=1 Tax=Pisum sativum TaxID=3888 RepID=A0A9D4YGL0_PEA|nr:hypothetical protein KIW84_024038 [Pisum sativum]
MRASEKGVALMQLEEDCQTLLTQFLIGNPQYTPRGSEPLNPHVDFYIWGLVNGGKGPNECFFGAGSLDDNLRKGDRALFQRVRDGEETSHPPQLTPGMLEIVRQLALTEVRRELAQRETALKIQMEAQQRQIEAMTKRQADMEKMMRQFMQSQENGNQTFGGNEEVDGQEQMDNKDDDNLNLDEFPDPDDPYDLFYLNFKF